MVIDGTVFYGFFSLFGESCFDFFDGILYVDVPRLRVEAGKMLQLGLFRWLGEILLGNRAIVSICLV